MQQTFFAKFVLYSAIKRKLLQLALGSLLSLSLCYFFILSSFIFLLFFSVYFFLFRCSIYSSVYLFLFSSLSSTFFFYQCLSVSIHVSVSFYLSLYLFLWTTFINNGFRGSFLSNDCGFFCKKSLKYFLRAQARQHGSKAARARKVLTKISFNLKLGFQGFKASILYISIFVVDVNFIF